MSRKTLVIIIGIVLVLVVSFLSWFFFFNNSPKPTATTTGTGLPFGQGPGNTPTGTGATNGTPVANNAGLNSNGQPVAALFQVSNTPVAGAIVIGKSPSTIIRFVDRATGHIYDVNPVTLEKIEITNNTFPKVEEAYFKSDGSSVLLRDLNGGNNTIENFSLALTAPKSTTTDVLYSVKTTALVGNLGDVSVGPTNLLTYILKSSGSVGTSAFDGSKSSNLFSSGFTDWRISWPNSSFITLTTKAGADISGFAYNLNISTGKLIKILGPLNGLTLVQSPDGKNIAYSYNSNGKTTFAFENLVDKSSNDILPTTFADKCIWSKKNVGVLYCGTPSGIIGSNEPNNWYQGITNFSDQIWKFNTMTLTSEILSDPKKDLSVDLDTENLSLSPNEDYLIFINKSDLTLWALKLQ